MSDIEKEFRDGINEEAPTVDLIEYLNFPKVYLRKLGIYILRSGLPFPASMEMPVDYEDNTRWSVKRLGVADKQVVSGLAFCTSFLES